MTLHRPAVTGNRDLLPLRRKEPAQLRQGYAPLNHRRGILLRAGKPDGPCNAPDNVLLGDGQFRRVRRLTRRYSRSYLRFPEEFVPYLSRRLHAVASAPGRFRNIAAQHVGINEFLLADIQAGCDRDRHGKEVRRQYQASLAALPSVHNRDTLIRMTTHRIRPEDIPPFLCPRNLGWTPSPRNETSEQVAARERLTQRLSTLDTQAADQLARGVDQHDAPTQLA